MGDQASGGVSVGRNRDITQQQNNYLGEVGHGPLDEFLKQLSQRYRQTSAQRDLAYGGSNYGMARPQTGGGPAPRPRGPGSTEPTTEGPVGITAAQGVANNNMANPSGRRAPRPAGQPAEYAPGWDGGGFEGGGSWLPEYGGGGGYGGTGSPGSGDYGFGGPGQGGNTPGGGNDSPAGGGTTTGFPQGANDLVDWFGPGGDGAQTPDGGLFGSYGQLANYRPTNEESWVGGRYLDFTGDPSTQEDRDILGGYQWQASGNRTGDEDAVNWRYRNVANNPLGELDQNVIDRSRIFADNPGATGIEGVTDKDLFNAFGEMTKTPGRGEDEAYNAYKGYLDRPGYDAATKSAIGQQGMLSARTASDSALQQLKNRQAVGGGSAGFYGAAGRLGRDTAGILGDQARQNQIDFAKEANRQTEVGASGMTNLASIGNQRRQYGASNQASLQNSARNARMYGNDMLANRSDAEYGRRMAGIQGMDEGNRALRGYQQAGLAGASQRADEMQNRRMEGLQGYQGYSDQMHNRRMQGLAGQQGLYDSNREDENNLISQILSGLRTPRETYNFDRGTSGSGGVSV